MANRHILSLEIPTVSNCNLLCIKDTSQYSENLAVECEELLITLPGYSVPVLIKVDKDFDNYDLTPAARDINDFVQEKLSNWYVRLCRRRFWKGEWGRT
mgnify:CR=1 FL=1